MFIDELKHRVSILAYVEQRDEYGGISGEWQEIARRWAKIEQNSANETFDNQQVKAVTSTRITMRYFAELTEKNRIKYHGCIFDVTGVTNELTGNYKTIAICKELKDGI